MWGAEKTDKLNGCRGDDAKYKSDSGHVTGRQMPRERRRLALKARATLPKKEADGSHTWESKLLRGRTYESKRNSATYRPMPSACRRQCRQIMPGAVKRTSTRWVRHSTPCIITTFSRRG